MQNLAQICALKAIESKSDPVAFCHFFLPHLFGGSDDGKEIGKIPWFHRGLLAILLRQVDFLWKYGEVAKIMREFAITRAGLTGVDDEPVVIGRIFRVFDRKSGFEYTWQDVAQLEAKYTPQELYEHLEIALHLTGRYTLIMIPRGFAKTTIAGIAIPLFKICHKMEKFFIYISETSTHAEMQVNNIRNELVTNERIRMAFGNLVPKRSGDEKWSERFFETTNGVAMAARGRGTQIRGLNHKGNRPGTILFDDLEDKDSVKTPEQRAKTKKWFFSDVIPALPRKNANATITGMGTMLDPDCLIENLAGDPDWITCRFSCMNKQGEPLWPDMMPLKEIQRERNSFARQGLLHLFYMEYFNKYMPESMQRFRKEYFRFAVVPPEKVVAWAIYCDPAIGKKRTSDRAVIQVAGVMEDGTIYMAAEWSERGHPDMVRVIVEHYFKLAKLFRPRFHGFESTAFQRALGTSLKDAMPRQGYYFEPIPINPTIAKNERISGILLPRMSSGFTIWHPMFENGETMQECLNWDPMDDDQPDDGPDCAAGCIGLLEDLAFGYSSDKNPEEIDEEEMDELEMVFDGQDWRWAP